MTNVERSTSGGLGIGGVVFVVLLVLKITGNITMSWFWVIASIVWAPVLAVLGLMLLFVVIGVGAMGGAIILSGIQRLFNG